MALTPAQKQKRYRERLKAREKKAPELTTDFLKQPFNEYLASTHGWEDVWYPLDWAGIGPDALPAFDSDDDPEHDPEADGPYRGSIGRAERLVGAFLDAATGLATIINRYKREQIEAAIARLEATDVADRRKRKQAIADIVRLNKIRDRLDKQVRWPLPEWKVKGSDETDRLTTGGMTTQDI
jgi:hypothetical protein